MDVLGDLIELITKKRVKKIELFDENSRNKQSNYYKLFEGIHAGRYQSDADAAADIYGCDASEKKYLILKTRLKQKLLNTLFFLDFGGSDVAEDRAIEYECGKSLLYARALLFNESFQLAIPTVEKTLRKAREYYLTTTELECVRILRRYTSQAGPYKDFLMYNELTEQIEQRMLTESRAQRYLQEATALLNKSKTYRDSVIEMTSQQMDELGPHLDEVESPRLRMDYSLIRALHYQLSDQHALAVATIEEAIAYARQHPAFFTRRDLIELLLRKMNFLLHLRDTEAAERTMQEANNYLVAQEEAWFVVYEYYFLIAMHAGQYFKAAQIFQDVLANSFFRTLSDRRKDRWRVFQAHLHFIYKNENLRDIRPLIQNSKTGFRLNEFMSDIPEFSKRERGLNVAKLTIQILFYLDRTQMDEVEKRTDAIGLYSRRYPKKDINFRSECLINLLTNMKEEDYRFYQTRKSTEKYFEEMAGQPMQYMGGNRGLEVIPFEKVWDWVLNKLKEYRYG